MFDYRDYFNGNSGSKLGRANNDNKRMAGDMIGNPGKALCDAVIENDPLKFHMLVGHARMTSRALNKAFFLAVGFERKEMEQSFTHRMAELTEASMKINLSERANGLLLRSIAHGNIHGVVASLRNPSVDVNCHDDECFKQAIIRDELQIADLLHGAGANISDVYADDEFMELVNKVEGGVTSQGRGFVYKLIGNPERVPTFEPAPAP